MTRPFSQLLSPRLGRYSQDIAGQDITPADLTEMRYSGQSSRASSIRYSLPAQGLRYRSDAYHLPQTAQPASGAGLSDRLSSELFGTLPGKLRVIAKANDYDTTHRLHIQRRLQHRIAVAMAKGDQPLVNLLQRELRQAS